MEEKETLMAEATPLLQNGAFLMSGTQETANPMTIGWCEFGRLWNRPCCIVFVRQSRYSHALMESGFFTVSVPGAGEMKEALLYCGTHSGRDVDKLSALQLRTRPPQTKGGAPALEGCALHFECKVLLSQLMDIAALEPETRARFYNPQKESGPDGDPHTVYFAEVLAAYR